MNKSFLSIQNFRKTFADVVAVENVSMEVPEGEFLTFLGPSGSGKSTTLYAIAGFEQPSSGDVLLKGKSLLHTPSHKRNIGMVFQRYTLFPHLSVGENVAFPLRVRKRPEVEVQATVKRMLELVRLEGLEKRMPGQLSGGQQQRVALARALSYKPPVLLMDEPLSALDKKLREEIQIELRRIHRETGVTILYVTHDQEEALRLSDRIAVFNRGRIEQIATGRELYVNPATRFVAGFIGDSNFLNVKNSDVNNGRAKVTLPDGTELSDVACHDDARSHDRPAELMVRPQSLTIRSSRSKGLKAKVKDITFLGDSLTVLFETAWGQEFWLRGPANQVSGIERSKTITLGIPQNECHLFR
jgi:putative spermidine/putrescine transport system ATP-binding protein